MPQTVHCLIIVSGKLVGQIPDRSPCEPLGADISHELVDIVAGDIAVIDELPDFGLLIHRKRTVRYELIAAFPDLVLVASFGTRSSPPVRAMKPSVVWMSDSTFDFSCSA